MGSAQLWDRGVRKCILISCAGLDSDLQDQPTAYESPLQAAAGWGGLVTQATTVDSVNPQQTVDPRTCACKDLRLSYLKAMLARSAFLTQSETSIHRDVCSAETKVSGADQHCSGSRSLAQPSALTSAPLSQGADTSEHGRCQPHIARSHVALEGAHRTRSTYTGNRRGERTQNARVRCCRCCRCCWGVWYWWNHKLLGGPKLTYFL